MFGLTNKKGFCLVIDGGLGIDIMFIRKFSGCVRDASGNPWRSLSGAKIGAGQPDGSGPRVWLGWPPPARPKTIFALLELAENLNGSTFFLCVWHLGRPQRQAFRELNKGWHRGLRYWRFFL